MNSDLGTTIIGGVIAAANAAQPVVAVANGTWDKNSIFQLIMSVGFAILGFFTNKTPKAV